MFEVIFSFVATTIIEIIHSVHLSVCIVNMIESLGVNRNNTGCAVAPYLCPCWKRAKEQRSAPHYGFT